VISVAIRSMAERKLRSVLTAVAILLGVAMIAGTYVQTDQIRSAFADIEQTARTGVDLSIAPKTAFNANFAPPDPIPESFVERVAGVPGVDRAEGQLTELGSLVVDGKAVEAQFAPTMVVSLPGEPFNPLQIARGELPDARGEVAVDRQLADRERLSMNQRVGVTTRSGVRRARVVGVVNFGDVGSLGGATLIVARRQDVQRWFHRENHVFEIVVSADRGVAPEELAGRVREVLPDTLVVKTGQQAVADAKERDDAALGFLRPALLAFAFAALMVGAFIIFNTFSITVAQRTREFALLRALGATRRQVLGAVAAEALLIGAAASGLGLLAGLGFARVLGALFDAAGFGIPVGDMRLAPRTIAVSLAVGIGVTLASALAPALRATRVAPVAAMRDEKPSGPRHPRLRLAMTVLVGLAGVGLLVQGLLGSGPAAGRLGAVGAGAALLFVTVALLARHLVGPLATVAGWPVERLGHMTGRLARENAVRNPGRTAVTAAALMVGLALVVFVAVFAAGLKDSLNGTVDQRLGNGLVITSDSITPLSAEVGARLGHVPGVGATSRQYVDQFQVDGKPVNAATDVLNGVDPIGLREIYRFEWVNGSDGAVDALRSGSALIEEQFAERHALAVGDSFTAQATTGRTARLLVRAVYRDPQLMTGAIVSGAQFVALSAATDPFAFYAEVDDPAASPEVVSGRASRALADFPGAKVRTTDEYREWLGGRVDQIIFLLYALLAMSLVISLFGIANSLYLSIHERTRELGMLRAIGATADQVRRLVRYESVITALIGGLLGTGVGLLFGWLTTLALADLGLGFAVPVGQLALLLLLAVVVGVVGAWLPARRAARLDVLEAVASE
jgi:putative ABC transport system permease protein